MKLDSVIVKSALATMVIWGATAAHSSDAIAELKPWLGPVPVNLAEPPANADEMALVQTRLAELDNAAIKNIYHWPASNPNYRWVQMALERYLKGPPSPIKGRGLAMINVAIFDAVVAANKSKAHFKRARPKNTATLLNTPDTYAYPSAHAAAAGAAASILSYLFPEEEAYFIQQSRLAADARVDAGVSFESDVAAGLELGKAVSDKAIRFAESDGSDTKFTGDRPTGPGNLKGEIFVYPVAGDWKTWAIASTEKYIPQAPLAIDSPELRTQMDELMAIERNVPASIRGWANHSTWRAYHWWYEKLATAVFERGSSMTMEDTALAYATISAANHDAILACFKAKYTYWMIRPTQLDPKIPALFPNPPHPSYPSAHSCSSKSYAVAISHFFPEQEAAVAAAAEEAGYSRMIAGIHYRMDKEAGEKLGQGVTNEVLDYARSLVSQ